MTSTASSSGQFPGLGFHTSASTTSLDPYDPTLSGGQLPGLRRCSSGASLAGSSSHITLPFNNIYSSIWRALLLLASDPHPEILKLAKEVIGYIKDRVSPKRLHLKSVPPSPSKTHIPSPTPTAHQKHAFRETHVCTHAHTRMCMHMCECTHARTCTYMHTPTFRCRNWSWRWSLTSRRGK